MYKLLIADDESLIREGIRKLVDFKSLGIDEVYEASSGLKAIELFETHIPELVLLDINMPILNGLEVAKRIKQKAPDTKIAIITGYDYFDYAVTALKIGVEDYMLKPISKQDVQDVLLKLIKAYEALLEQRELRNALSSILSEALKTTSNTEKEDTYKMIIQDYVFQNAFKASFSLSELADHVGLNTNYLSSVFKTNFGIPFQDYILNMRLERAKILLLSTEMKNYEIAEAIGIDDVNYFGVRFKNKFGLSPKQYKQRIKAHEK
ncbi:response regulator [Fusibacter sp. 3D3]|uniref:response regulator transcription factor n=1 Tax=Fusibacter sp. 3D3 TaxID=1048380 RepID=UPI0008537132|nr:response regulator [Fusibacter sp. 3D3]GAU77274.1 two-component response regulator yesN associated with MetSO reductase [Fusibacter sp. 3D3]